MNPTEPDTYVVVLGNMQDAGLPHAGCVCRRCRAAFADPAQAAWAACVALVDMRTERPQVWLFDATPDIKHQLNQLADLLGKQPNRQERLRQPDGVFLTHGHMGHTGGLMHFGPEAMNAVQLPLYAPSGLIEVLRRTALWQPAISGFSMRPLINGQELRLAPDLKVTAVSVPHRDEWGAGTFAYKIAGPQRKLLYLPDIDSWAVWPAALSTLAGVDVALIDASFYSPGELGGRAPVAHPLVPDTLKFMRNLPLQLVLTHINHTNPILDDQSVERATVQDAGVLLASPGMIWAI